MGLFTIITFFQGIPEALDALIFEYILRIILVTIIAAFATIITFLYLPIIIGDLFIDPFYFIGFIIYTITFVSGYKLRAMEMLRPKKYYSMEFQPIDQSASLQLKDDPLYDPLYKIYPTSKTIGLLYTVLISFYLLLFSLGFYVEDHPVTNLILIIFLISFPGWILIKIISKVRTNPLDRFQQNQIITQQYLLTRKIISYGFKSSGITFGVIIWMGILEMEKENIVKIITEQTFAFLLIFFLPGFILYYIYIRIKYNKIAKAVVIPNNQIDLSIEGEDKLIKSNLRYCSSCGDKRDHDELFCGNCGEKY